MKTVGVAPCRRAVGQRATFGQPLRVRAQAQKHTTSVRASDKHQGQQLSMPAMAALMSTLGLALPAYAEEASTQVRCALLWHCPHAHHSARDQCGWIAIKQGTWGECGLTLLSLALSICCGMTAQVAPEFAGFTPAELFILALPIVSYGLFNIVRDKVNPKASLSDFFLIVATLVILGNIFSILVLKASA
jgi:hypothetical protein